MTTGARLLSEPFDFGAIEADLNDPKFLGLAFFLLGTTERWRAALDQAARLIDGYEESGRDDRTIWRQLVVSLLVRRAETFNDTAAFLDELVERLGILPEGAIFEEIKLAHHHKKDPEWWRKEQNRRWLEAYRSRRKVFDSRGEQATDTKGDR